MARTDTLGNFLTDVAEAIRTKEGTNETIPASEFDTRISNLSGGEDLSAELTTYETELEEQNVTLEDIIIALQGKVAGDGGSMVNVFAQQEEPRTKDGIWLQTTENYDSVSLWKRGTAWLVDDYVTTIPYTFNTGHGAIVGDNVYLFGGDGGTTTAYKYNLTTRQYTKLPNIPWQCSYTRCVVKGTDIYVGGSWSTTTFGKFDTLTETFTKLASTPHRIDGASAAIVGDFIYMFGGNSTRYIAKYDILNNSWTRLSVQTPELFLYGDPFVIGTDIYYINPSVYNGSAYVMAKNNYKFDTLTDTFVTLETPVLENFKVQGAVKDDDFVYLFGSTIISPIQNSACTYYPASGKYVVLDAPPQVTSGSGGMITKYNGQILMFGQSEGWIMTKESDISPQYLGKTVSVAMTNEGVDCKLVKTPLNFFGFDEHCIVKINDIDYYNEDTESVLTVPIYCGDGTQWVKFKN